MARKERRRRSRVNMEVTDGSERGTEAGVKETGGLDIQNKDVRFV